MSNLNEAAAASRAEGTDLPAWAVGPDGCKLTLADLPCPGTIRWTSLRKAEVLAAITGSPYFPGGMGTNSNYVLGFENGPSQPITLQWATYYDAADQAGISRIWGGIHPPIDNLTGRRAGAQCGQGVWTLAQKYFDGSVLNSPMSIALQQLGPGADEIRCNSVRGLYYKLQSTTDLSVPFADEPGDAVLAYDASVAITNVSAGVQKFYRMACSLGP